jgi:hypothetical protein
MKTIFTFIFLINFIVNFGQNQIAFDTIYAGGDIMQINEIGSIKRLVKQSNFNWRGYKISEGQLKQYDSIRIYNYKKNHVGDNIEFLISEFIGSPQENWQTQETIPSLYQSGEWKYYDSVGIILKIVIYDTCAKHSSKVRLRKQYGVNSGPWPGGSRIDVLPKKITYYYKKTIYKEEHYANGLLFDTWEWNKKP